jgi:hypothetical protein
MLDLYFQSLLIVVVCFEIIDYKKALGRRAQNSLKLGHVKSLSRVFAKFRLFWKALIEFFL